MKRACCLTLYGRVQGVSFRWHTREKALELGITGFVCNQFDGSVHAQGEGGAEAMEEWIRWCGQGPAFARVDRVEMAETEVQGFVDFQIRPTR